MLPLLAQLGGYTLIHWIVVIIVLAAVIGIMYVALNQFGVQIPPWALKIFWIVVVAAVAIIAIKFLLGMA